MLVRVCDKCGDQNSDRINVGVRTYDLCFDCHAKLAQDAGIMKSVWKGNYEPLSRWLLDVPLPEYDDLENAAQRLWRDWDNEQAPIYTHCGHTYGCTCPACTGKLINVGKI